MTISELIYGTKGIDLLDADVLMGHTLDVSREFLYSNPEHTVTSAQKKKYQQLVKRRKSGEPVAYLTGYKEFYGLEFMVTPDVLIPRPDTELLVETVLEYLEQLNSNSRDAINRVSTVPPTIVDLGTGSGNIAVAIKKHDPNCTMLATDVSKKAVAVAKKNAKLNNVNVSFFTGDVLSALPDNYQHALDVVIFNAPYLTKTEAKKQMLAYEPQVALTPEGEPTQLIERMFSQVSEYLAPEGAIFLEMGHRQGNQIKKLAKKYLPGATVEIKKDFGGFDRLVVISTYVRPLQKSIFLVQ